MWVFIMLLAENNVQWLSIWRLNGINAMARADLKPSLTNGRGVNQTPELIASYSYSREFTQRRRRRQRERHKSNGFRPAQQQLCTCITLFCTFLCRRCTTTTWNCLISGFVEDGNKRQLLSFSFPELWCTESFRIQLQKRLPTFDELNEME